MILEMKKYTTTYPRVIDGEWQTNKYAKAYVLLVSHLMKMETIEKYELCCSIRDIIKLYEKDSFFIDGTIKQKSKETLYDITKTFGKIDIVQWDPTRNRAAITINFFNNQYNFFVNYEEYISLGGEYTR